MADLPTDRRTILGGLAGIAGLGPVAAQAQPAASDKQARRSFDLSDPLPVSRSISPENPTGAPGAGGREASELGAGRKGRAWSTIAPRSLFDLARISGSGTINRIWLTLRDPNPARLRSLVLRAYWDGQDSPSIECPLGDFFGLAHGRAQPIDTALHACLPRWGFTSRIPMPFARGARIVVENPLDVPVSVFYSVDYSLEAHATARLGYLHARFGRQNPTRLTEDFEILPRRTGRGRFLGCVLGIRHRDDGSWWGEGEVKMYLDDDTSHPTICGTGTEDYVGMGWGVAEFVGRSAGCLTSQRGFAAVYRWHLDDPVYWNSACRITVQQLGWDNAANRMVERADDWSATAFWYETLPSTPLAPLPSLAERTADLWVGQ